MILSRIIVNQIKEKLHSSKLFFLVLIVFFVNTQIIDGLRHNAIEVNSGVNCFEPFIAVTNSAILQIIIPVVYILILHDFPHVFGKYYFYTYRIGRKLWLKGQLVCSLIFAFFYSVFIFVLSDILIIERLAYNFDWSNSVVQYYQIHKGEYNSSALLITPSTFYQGSVIEVFIYSFVLLVLYLFLINLIQILFFTYGVKYFGNVVCIAIGIVGAVLNLVSNNLKWILPVSNSVFYYHFENYTGKPKYQISFSILYFSVLIFLLVYICERKIRVAYLYDSSEE